jgi:hypothetical protein
MLMTGISVSIAVIYYSLNLRNVKRARHTQMLAPLISWFFDKDSLKIWNDVMYNWEF